MTIILTIRDSNNSWAGRSPLISRHRSDAEARAALAAYVSRNWDAEVGTVRPHDPDEMIEQYFTAVPETYDLRQIPEDRQ